VRAILRLLGALVLALCACLLAAWTLGRLVSDRWVWSQYLLWMPTVLVAPAAAVLWALGSGLAAVSGRSSTPRGRRWMRRAIGGAGAWVALVALYLLVIECRVYRLPRAGRPTVPHVRVLNWNVTAVQRIEQITGPVAAQDPDIAILVNPHSYVKWSDVPAALEFKYKYLNTGGIAILSRVPEVRYGMVWLGIAGLPPETASEVPHRKGWTDPGRAMFIEFDTTATLGRTTVVWIVDLPSEPKLSRWKMMRKVAESIGAWEGPVTVVDGVSTHSEPAAQKGFPRPDLVLGDFNTPRGSASLSHLVPGMKNAFDEVGAGYSATWPRFGFRTPIPLLQLDQMFLGAGVTMGRYEVVDPGFGFHQMQVGDLVQAKGDRR
jgi:hypothetical protein